jgi:hypothetical protein
MKKVLYSIALVVVLAVSFSSCTEEVVKPKDTTTGGGSGGTDCTKGC